MGKGQGSVTNVSKRPISWEEVKRHTGYNDRWIVIKDQVYDISNFQKSHPGGAKIIGHFAGQDATQVWAAMHREKDLVEKYMKAIHVGTVQGQDTEDVQNERLADYEDLRNKVEEMGLFEIKKWFFFLYFVQLVVLECLAYLVMSRFGTSWLPYLTSVFLLTVFQAQAGWVQHDYGHWSVFKNRKLNHCIQHFIIGFGKGASKHWWNFRHMQHHAKTNVFKKDPDITLPHVFLLGDKIPRRWGLQKRGMMPYQYEHLYFWLLGPATLVPIYFHLEILYFIFKRRDWTDLTLMVAFFVRHFSLYGPLLGGWSAFGLYMLVRFFESFWFTFVTQMSHLPMDIDSDQEHDWLKAQTLTTCNVQPGIFNDWFTGHLNYQIEHHLFPTMPRHNFHKVAPLVRSLCKKHNLPYVEKSLGVAFADILTSLKKSGQLWYDAYYHT
nr:front-end fatty acid desaturase group B iso2 [Platynereis dumerilii]